jgi:response regulator RpfG family c-di-GMP phosphodiesterase
MLREKGLEVEINIDEDEKLDDSEILMFADEENTNLEESNNFHNKWRILVVDDEESIYKVTKIVLNEVMYDGRRIELLYAESYEKAKVVLASEEDICIVYLDVVMETDNAGLCLVKYIREELRNRLIRIIIRTGQPGLAPERKLIEEYDINGYLLKTDFTADKLYTNTVTSLRAFLDLEYLTSSRKTMQKLVKATTVFINNFSLNDFQTEIISQLCSLIKNERDKTKDSVKGFIALRIGDDFVVETSSKNYNNIDRKNINDILSLEEVNIFLDAKNNPNKVVYRENILMYYFVSELGYDKIIFLKKEKFFTGMQKEIYDIFINHVCMAFDNISLGQEVDNVQKEMIYKLGEIAELRSKESSYHVKRVAEYSALLGEKYGLDRKKCDVLRLSAPLHDVGKIGISDTILNKPDRLTAEEFSIIKTHCIIGNEMLKNTKGEVMKAAAIIALQHHERYDGKGYPYGLRGEEIDIYARIVSIADVFDALSSRRVYKEAWDIEKILELFKEERGKQFDDVLTDLFLENLDEFIRIKDLSKDKELIPF